MNALRLFLATSLLLLPAACSTVPLPSAASGGKSPVAAAHACTSAKAHPTSPKPAPSPARKAPPSPVAAPHDYAKWEKDIAAYEKEDQEQSPPKGGILFVGSSTFRLWKTMKEDFAGLPVINRGFGGSTFPELNHYFDRLVPQHQPRVIVVYEGDNDTGKGHTTERVLANWQVFARKARKACPDAKVLFVSIKPSLKREALLPKQQLANEAIRRDIESRENMAFVDMVPDMLDADGRPLAGLLAADQLHMSPEGYALWTRKLRPLLEDAPAQ